MARNGVRTKTDKNGQKWTKNACRISIFANSAGVSLFRVEYPAKAADRILIRAQKLSDIRWFREILSKIVANA